MKTTKITKLYPNRTPGTEERIAALRQRIRDKIDNQLINMVLDNLIANIKVTAALYRAHAEGWNDGWAAAQMYWMGRDA